MSDFAISEWGPCACPLRLQRGGPIVPHWRSLVPSKYVSHYDLSGNDVVVTISSIKLAEVIGSGGKKSQKALVAFKGKEKGMVMGATCLKTIAGLYGDDYATWVGKAITIYPTTTEASGETVGTIRIRPVKPTSKAAAAVEPPEPGSEG
jgi:hypothetical protein